MMGERGIILRETAISIVINMLFSAFFFWLVFGTPAFVALAGAQGLGRDFIPQTFMVALMGSLVPSLIVRHKRGLQQPTVALVTGQSLVSALASAVLGGEGHGHSRRRAAWSRRPGRAR